MIPKPGTKRGIATWPEIMGATMKLRVVKRVVAMGKHRIIKRDKRPAAFIKSTTRMNIKNILISMMRITRKVISTSTSLLTSIITLLKAISRKADIMNPGLIIKIVGKKDFMTKDIRGIAIRGIIRKKVKILFVIIIKIMAPTKTHI